jgi:hypothetical protein
MINIDLFGIEVIAIETGLADDVDFIIENI